MDRCAGVDPQPGTSEGLPCVNCRKAVSATAAKFFDGVFLCENCHAIAHRIEERLGNELKMMQLMLHEAIRVACCEQKLHLSERGVTDGASKKDVLEAIVTLAERKQARKIGAT